MGEYTYYRCPSCRSLFLYPLPSREQLAAYYKHEFTYGNGAEEWIRRRARITIHRLKHMHPRGYTLLDIGSGSGYFLEEAARLGLDASGIEPSQSLYEYSRKKGLSVRQTDLRNLRDVHMYDFVTMIHVIEHLQQPRDAVAKAARLLRNNGVLYMETPNSASWLFQAEQARYTFLTPPDHLWLFSEQSLKRISHPLIPTACTTYSYPEHFVGVVRHLFKKPFRQAPPNVMVSDSVTAQLAPKRRLSMYMLLHLILAPILYRILNIGNKGTILELYLRKNGKKC